MFVYVQVYDKVCMGDNSGSQSVCQHMLCSHELGSMMENLTGVSIMWNFFANHNTLGTLGNRV
mgnify:CR=1 FL=1